MDAQFGITHDGDAGRMIPVDDTGTFVQKDALFARDPATDGDVVAAPDEYDRR